MRPSQKVPHYYFCREPSNSFLVTNKANFDDEEHEANLSSDVAFILLCCLIGEA